MFRNRGAKSYFESRCCIILNMPPMTDVVPEVWGSGTSAKKSSNAEAGLAASVGGDV